MSDGICGAHYYGNIDQTKINAILKALRTNGATVSGTNPWTVDTHKYGVTLEGSWNQGAALLTVTVTGKDFFVPCSQIWATVDPLIHHVSSLAANDAALVGAST